jgi:MFS family permease
VTWQDRGVRQRTPLVLLESANLLSGVSNALVVVAVPWLILERGGTAAAAGLAGALAGLPGIVVSPLAGALVDRLGRRTVSIGSDLLSALSVVLFPLLDLVGRLDVGLILWLTVLGAAFDPAGYTARKSLIPDVVRASGSNLDDVNGVHEGLLAAGWVVGPATAALTIATVGAVQTMWVAGVAFLVAAAAVWALGVPNRARTDDGGEPADTRGSVWSFAVGGLRALVADRPVWILTLAVAVLSLIYLPTESVLLPVHFEAQDQPGGFGLVLSALAAGGMVGSFGYGWLAARMSRYRISTVFLSAACVAYLPMALLPPTPVMLGAAFLLGLAWGPMSPLLNALVQDRFPADQHGRVYGVQQALFYAAPPMGQLLAGVAVVSFGVRAVFLALAAAMVVTAAVVDLLPSLRGLDTTPAERMPG